MSESDYSLKDSGSRNCRSASRFIESAKFKIAAEHGTNVEIEYSIKTLETRYFLNGVIAQLVKEQAKDPIIGILMKPDSILSKPVYMITGVQITKGFRIRYPPKAVPSAGAS